jgi:NAD(P)-dependent dehydrogenase (short-subunit alcohol dehydrogenase family)
MTANATHHRPTALITGAAKRLGAEIATHLAAHGYDIVLHYHRSHAEAEVLAAQLTKAHGAKVTLHAADLAQTAGLNSFWQGLPHCDVLVLNAATYQRDSLASMDAQTLRLQLAVNFEAPLLLAQGFMAQLTREGGNIIVLGDGTLGWSVAPQFFSYAASKLAWAGTIDLLAAAAAPKARANVLALAPTLPGETDDEALFTHLAARAPLGRTGEPSDVLAAIDFVLASPAITGQVISLANGMGLRTKRPEA